jgi:hypothetical protein
MPVFSAVVLGTATAARGVVVVICGDALVRASGIVGIVSLILFERRLRA